MPVLIFFMTSLVQGSRTALVLLLLFISTGCSRLTLADLQVRNPDAYAGRICAFPREVPEGVRIIAYQRNTQRIVTDEDEMEIKLFAPAADLFVEYDPDAPLSSIDVLPSSMGLVCKKRTRAFPASTVLFQEKQSPCPVETADSDVLRQPRDLAGFVEEILGNERPDVRFLAQPVPTRSPWLQPLPGVAYPPNCETLIREAAKREASRVSEEIGKRFGRAMGDYQSSFNSVGVMDGKRRMQILRQYPLAFETLQIDLAQKLNAIPELPAYDDPEIAQAAVDGFERGYGAGMDEAKRQALAIDLAWAMAQSLCGNVACAVETAGIKALQLAVARLRAMPLFIPGTTNGVGFFLKRLPQASVQGTAAATTGAAATEANTTETAVRTFTRAKPTPAETPPSTVGTNAAPSVAKTIAGATEPNGQLHHAISERVFAAIQKNDKLKGSFKLRDSQFTARAANLEAHNGYQKWHEELDKEIVAKIEAKEFLSAKDFAVWLYKRYKQPDLVKRFPNGLGANQ